MESNPNLTTQQEGCSDVVIPCDDSDDSAKCFHLDFDDQAAFHLVNFYEPESVDEHRFRWSEPVAMVRLDVPASDYEITIETASLRCGGLSFPFRIYWNDQVINKKQVRLQDGKIIFDVTRSMFIRNDEQRLTISCKPLRAEKGRRQLGLPVKWIRLQQTGSTDPEFANPTKTRSRLWRRDASLPNFRKLIGIKSPSPSLPIWEMKLPNTSTSLRGQSSEPQDNDTQNDLVIVSSVEINSRHGTGLLIQYMFEDFSQITTVSSQRCFHGDRVRSAKHFEVPFQALDRHQIYELVLNWFKASPPKRAYVVPYYKTELLVAIALSDLFGTEVCLHVMDDQCLYEDEISFGLMQESLDKASLVFVISPEMRDAYQERFQHRIFILPPVVPESMIRRDENPAYSERIHSPAGKVASGASAAWEKLAGFVRRKPKPEVKPLRGIIIGNIWDEKWLEKLQSTIRGSGVEVDWFSNNPDAIMLSSQKDLLASSGIHLRKPLWSDDLVRELRERPYAIMPSGMLGHDEERESLARLSLPSRLPFVMSVSHIPIIVLGSPATAAAKFVDRFRLGKVIDYEQQQFRATVDEILEPDVQKDIRARSRKLAASFSARNLANWIDDSIRLKQPIDSRFETLFDGEQFAAAHLVSRQTFERRSNWNKEKLWQMLGRLKKQGIVPKQVVDVGSGDGAWSWATSQVFPDAKYFLIEPLLDHYNRSDCEQFGRSLGESSVVSLPLGSGVATNNSDSATGQMSGIASFTNTLNSTPTASLDQLAVDNELSGPVLLKIDVPENAFQIIAGGKQFIEEHVDAIVVTVDLAPRRANCKLYVDYLSIMHGLNYQLVDESVAKRCPQTEILMSKNLVFVKREFSQKRLAA